MFFHIYRAACRFDKILMKKLEKLNGINFDNSLVIDKTLFVLFNMLIYRVYSSIK